MSFTWSVFYKILTNPFLFCKAEEQLKLVEEQRKMLEEKQKLEDEQRQQLKVEQAVILNKKNARPKLSFSIGGRWSVYGDLFVGYHSYLME